MKKHTSITKVDSFGSPTLTSQFEEVKLIYRNKTKAADRPVIRNPEDAYEIFKMSWDMDQIELLEEVKMMMLDRQMRMMSIASISKGGMSGSIIDPKIVFGMAVKRRAHRIILAHNHPSGCLNPSKSDVEITKKLSEAGKVLDISLEDHLIMTKESYSSITNDFDI